MCVCVCVCACVRAFVCGGGVVDLFQTKNERDPKFGTHTVSKNSFFQKVTPGAASLLKLARHVDARISPPP